MKNYSYLLALTLGLMQIGTTQAIFFNSSNSAADSIEVPKFRPALESLKNANINLVQEFNNAIDNINDRISNSLEDTSNSSIDLQKSREDLTRLHHLVQESYTPLISKAVDQTTQDQLKSESNNIREIFNSTMKSLNNKKRA